MSSEKVAKNNRLLIIDQKNVLTQRPGYLAIPWAFKRIINKVLTPRELAVYVQIGFYMDKNEVCFPSLDQLAADMHGVSRGNQLSAPIGKPVDKGFLLKRKRALPWRAEKYKKLVFQRPAVEHTLRTLRIRGYITQEEYKAASEEWGKAGERTRVKSKKSVTA